MNNGNTPATSIEFRNPNDSGGTDIGQWRGLTKREHFAGLAMQGLMTSRNATYSKKADMAVQMADALLKELSK